ncbi:YfhO family protein [Liquorilactobacillus mali]|uniref:YfhO family protein n=1 Tax=Liquorilactobacillus mali TaxID=1618 RepID=UPI00264D028D|nr:YfhO family protein [Liquorilactobacillus mali]MDN7145492.1 YfhO family protein [Liquorilactobacillus mali]
MIFSFTKKNNLNLYLQYTAIFALIAFFVYGTYFVTGHSLIWHIDGAQQHLPLLEEFRKTLLGIMKHPFSSWPQWSFKLGLGGDIFQINAYYVTGDIFNYLILLFPASKIIFAYQFLIMLRLYCVGLIFCYFASHFSFKNSIILSGTVVYLFNAFLLYANIAQPFFSIPFMIFPLLILGIERVLQQKSFWPLTFAFCWMLFSNFYFAYILGFGALLYLILRYLITYRKKIAFFKTFFKLGLSTVISLSVTAILWVPEMLAVFSSTRSNAPFANGLRLYPLYYYLALPSQLINGGNRNFYFWSALGFASISFFAIVFVLIKIKKYPLLGTSFILGLIMLLFPQFGALFNGLTSPSNRWTLMLSLPIAISVCVLIEQLHKLTHKTKLTFTYCLAIYSFWIFLSYFFQNDEKLFIPMAFLFISYGFLVYYSAGKKSHANYAFLALVVVNVIFNAIYFEAPYNGGYSNEMLPLKSYEKLVKTRYAGLDKDLKSTNSYRVSTISQNYNLGSGFHMYNAQPNKLNSITSYYSLQNINVGNFARKMQNSQYEANIPISQFSDRTVLNNFLGVRYIFAQINQKNSAKIPANYLPEKASTRLASSSDNQSDSTDTQTVRYKTEQAFPLIYWQNTVIDSKQFKSMTTTARERALATGVHVSNSIAKHYTKAKTADDTQELEYYIVSSHGNVVSTANLEHLDSTETYKIILKNPDNYKNSELHVELSDIKYHQLSLTKQIQIEQNKQATLTSSGIISNNDNYNYYRYLRYHILNGSPDNSFSINVSSSLGTESITQPKQSELSFYKTVKSGLLNLGYFTSTPKYFTLTPSKLGTYDFKLKIVAEKLGKKYNQEVAKIQKNRLKSLKFSKNKVTGIIKTTQKGILTSSIPFSKGWSIYDNGQKLKAIKTNTGFLGTQLKSGSHHIELIYSTPGLKTGKLITIGGIFLIILSASSLILIKKIFFHKTKK